MRNDYRNIDRMHTNQLINGTDRYINSADITLPPGYRIEVFAQGLNAPGPIIFTEEGDLLIAETGYTGGIPKIVRISDGQLSTVAEGFDPPITGINYFDGLIYVTERGRISVVKPDGTKQIVLDGFFRQGDHYGSNVAFGADGRMYVAQGTRTNSGVVGLDNTWLYEYPYLYDYPGTYIMVRGQNYETPNLFSLQGEPVFTGGYSPYGVPNLPFEIKKGIVKASGAVMSAYPDGSELELVAWGFRYPFHLRFDRSNRLFTSNISYEVRGSRPIANAPDEFHLVIPGQWYGWPDYAAGEPVTLPRFRPETGVQPEFILLNHPGVPPKPYASFPSASYIAGFDFNYNSNFGSIGDAYIAEFGGGGRITPGVTTPYVGLGHRISKIDMLTGGVTTFAMNKSGFPSSITGEGGFVRPADVKFGPDGAMYISDLATNELGDLSAYIQNTGIIWRVLKL